MRIRSLTPTAKPAAPRERRQTLAIEPRVAKLVRQVMRHERILLTDLIEQALIAWIREWRPVEYKLEIEGPLGPPKRTRIVALGGGRMFREKPKPKEALGLAHRISEEEVRSTKGFEPNPRRKPKSKPKRKAAKKRR